MPHIIVPVGQAVTQELPWHKPPVQAMPQSPQPPPVWGNVPGRHWQAPPVQYCEPMHIVHWAPHCNGSDDTSAQAPPHVCAGGLQTHWPLTHC